MQENDDRTNKTGEGQEPETGSRAVGKKKKAALETGMVAPKDSPVEEAAVAPSDTENQPLTEPKTEGEKPPDNKPEGKNRLAKLLEKRKVLNARIQQEENRLNAQKRKLETRRKILAGAWLLDEMEKQEDFKEVVYKKLDSFLTRPDDRALFDLPPLPEKTADKNDGKKDG